VIWLLLQLTFAASLARAAVRARQWRQEWWARVDVRILGYWVAFVVNGAFDVFLEGPQGGIWFWSLLGFGIAALRAQRYQRIGIPARTSARILPDEPRTAGRTL